MRSKLKPLPRRDVRHAVLLLLVSVTATVLVVLWCERKLARFGWLQGETESVHSTDFQRSLARLDRQKDQRTALAYTIVSAIVAITVLKKVFPAPVLRYAYALLPPAVAFMAESARAGDVYESRVAFLLLKNSVTMNDVFSVYNMVGLQLMFLDMALGILGLFVMLFFVAIITGAVSPAGGAGEQ